MPKIKTKNYKEVESLECFSIDYRTNQCDLMYTPEALAFSIPMNEEPLRVNIVSVSGDCILMNEKMKCSFDYDANCKLHQPVGKSIVLACQEE